ncbi:uncharacterized protein JCM6883_005556 [Sporobolomyces salmoneus]|uniref:uncharacterized protein n=1 Tax=Sporobolomyces salmoneus TaxID=183962 RepID=UPI00317D2F2D
MPRQQPRRASRASTGSYTSFFSSHAGAGDSTRTSTSPSSSSSASMSSPLTNEDSASPPSASTSRAAPSQSTPPNSTKKRKLSPEDSLNLSISTPQRHTDLATVEQALETLFQSSPGPVHSLKHVTGPQRQAIESEMNRIGMGITLRSWWTRRQRQSRMMEKGSNTSNPTTRKPKSKRDVGRPLTKVPVETRGPDIEVDADDKSEFKAIFIKEEEANPKMSSSVETTKKSSLDFTPRLESKPLGNPSASVTSDVSFDSQPSVHPGATASSTQLQEPDSILNATRCLFPLTKPEPERQASLVETRARYDSTIVPQEKEEERVIVFPALTLEIGTWARRAAVDPSQLSVVYSVYSDSIVFSTQHLESIYHLHLPVSSISFLVVFHSLPSHRSFLLIYRTLSPLPHLQPRFTLSRLTHGKISGEAVPINDFTPSQIASSHPLYALELTETSLVPPLLASIDRISPTLKLEGKLFVGPWREETGLSLEDLIGSCEVVQKKRAGQEGAGEGGGETESLRYKYQGEDPWKVGEELWARKWRV